MLKKWTFILFLFWTVQGNAQILWKISGNGLKNPSYLLGTHHAASGAICDSIAGFQEAFDSCSQLYGEIFFDDMEALSQQILPYTLLPKDSLLDVILTPEDYKLLDGILKEMAGVGAEPVKNLKPVVLSAQLAMLISMNVLKNRSQPLDVLLQSKAKEKGMPVKGFETVLFQSQLLFNAPLDEQVADFVKQLRNFDKVKEFQIKLCEVFMKQDIEGMFRLVEDKEFGFNRVQKERLVDNRNRNWVGQLREILPQQATFIAVGCGHLPGEQGVINLLRQQGYTLTPVR